MRFAPPSRRSSSWRSSKPSRSSPESERPDVNKAIDRGAAWLDGHLAKLRRATPDALYNVWGHSYSIQCLGRTAQASERQSRAPGQVQRAGPIAGRHAGPLQLRRRRLVVLRFPGRHANAQRRRLQLHHRHRASSRSSKPRRSASRFPSDSRRKRSPRSSANRNPTSATPTANTCGCCRCTRINRPGGSLGRSQACNLALRCTATSGSPTTCSRRGSTACSPATAGSASAARRPIPHESFFYVAGYFYYYGHWHAALCIDQLPAAERPHFQDHLAHIILPLQERDGSWWDFPLYNYHQQYGTAMAVMTLVRCQRRWSRLCETHLNALSNVAWSRGLPPTIYKSSRCLLEIRPACAFWPRCCSCNIVRLRHALHRG